MTHLFSVANTCTKYYKIVPPPQKKKKKKEARVCVRNVFVIASLNIAVEDKQVTKGADVLMWKNSETCL